MEMKDILNLSVTERMFMVEAIWDSIINDPKSENLEVSDAIKKELDNRIKSHLKNPTQGSTWEEAKARILKRK